MPCCSPQYKQFWAWTSEIYLQYLLSVPWTSALNTFQVPIAYLPAGETVWLLHNMLVDGLTTMCVDMSIHNILYGLRLEEAKVLFL